MAVNWELQGCCGHNQRIFIAAVGVSTVVILLLWRTFLLTPFKLITVFLHETSHALACKLTCGDGFDFIKDLGVLDLVAGLCFPPIGKYLLLLESCTVLQHSCEGLRALVNECPLSGLDQVEGMQVHANEGGVTQTRGGIYWIILPAGYLGSSFWGMIFILASTNLLTTRIAAGCFILALVVVLFVADNWFLRWLCIGFVVFIAVVWVIQEFTSFHILKYVILFIGEDLLSVLINEMFSNYLDIYDDLISRRVHSSDAEKFAEICPCPCNGVGWGVIWSALQFQ
ncbi:hypothetical protein C2845_PM02G29850 [Panicum miliaceum]|uniref:Uncharacterized protein n=1 Tax=Panicum miliaceum TaxID=4540 RepID=A0A3L6SE94_PANMI|nr:hypothetical protein C2845_PM02G29850 [Panicum miliaceum]